MQKLTQEQVSQAKAAVAQAQAKAKGKKAAKGTPKFLVRFAVNRMKRQAFSEYLGTIGYPTSGKPWDKAKSQVGIS